METLSWPLSAIVNTAIELQQQGTSSASTGERIAAAFVLNNMNYLPASYPDVVEAWERLGSEWQGHVKTLKQNYMHLIEGGG